MSSSITYIWGDDFISPYLIPVFPFLPRCHLHKGPWEHVPTTFWKSCRLRGFSGCFSDSFFHIQQVLSHEKNPLSNNQLQDSFLLSHLVMRPVVCSGWTHTAVERHWLNNPTRLFLSPLGSLSAPHPLSLWHVAQWPPVAFYPVSLHSAHITPSMTPWKHWSKKKKKLCTYGNLLLSFWCEGETPTMRRPLLALTGVFGWGRAP